MAQHRKLANDFVHVTNDLIVPSITVFGLIANLLILFTLAFFKQKRAINIYLGSIAFYDIIILITGEKEEGGLREGGGVGGGGLEELVEMTND